jgi:adenylate cyclase class 2
MLEIEQKYRSADLDEIAHRIFERFEVRRDRVVQQSDCYFLHPGRDFVKTDEALRLRRTRVDGVDEAVPALLTYKGPRISTDGRGKSFKTRQEIELPLGTTAGDGDRLVALLSALGFVPTDPVVKTRRSLQACYNDWNIEFALDQVVGLGSFVEIEIVTAAGMAEEAREVIAEIARQMELESPITDSYRNMLSAL